jgi:hypothetical protein
MELVRYINYSSYSDSIVNEKIRVCEYFYK